MSFLNWIRKGVDDTPSLSLGATTGLQYDFRGWHLFRMEDLINVVLRRDYSALMYAFTWNATPQGHAYWYRRCLGAVDLGEEDLLILSDLYRYCLDNEIPDNTHIQ